MVKRILSPLLLIAATIYGGVSGADQTIGRGNCNVQIIGSGNAVNLICNPPSGSRISSRVSWRVAHDVGTNDTLVDSAIDYFSELASSLKNTETKFDLFPRGAVIKSFQIVSALQMDVLTVVWTSSGPKELQKQTHAPIQSVVKGFHCARTARGDAWLILSRQFWIKQPSELKRQVRQICQENVAFSVQTPRPQPQAAGTVMCQCPGGEILPSNVVCPSHCRRVRLSR